MTLSSFVERHMTTIKQQDFIQSIADAFHFISFCDRIYFVQAMAKAYDGEESPAAKNAIAQILMNSRMSAEGHRPVCQDTGIAVVFLKIGMNVRWDATMSVQEMVDEGVRRAYTDKDNPLRASVLADPDGARKNTRDNAPAVVHMEVVPGDRVEVKLAAKGGGSESKSRFAVLNPSDDVVELNHIVTGVENGKARLALRAAALRGQLDLDAVARHDLHVNHRRRVVACVFAGAVR